MEDERLQERLEGMSDNERTPDDAELEQTEEAAVEDDEPLAALARRRARCGRAPGCL
jgi:hypothetical protein